MPSPFAADKFGSMAKRLDQSKAAAAERKASIAKRLDQLKAALAARKGKDTQEVPKETEKPQEPPSTSNKSRHRMETEWQELARSICTASPGKSPSGFDTKVHEHDVILGEGSSNHPGNVYYRSLVKNNKDEYDRCPRLQNHVIPSRIVAAVRDQKPSGRFLRHFSQNPTASPKLWYDVGTEEALDCTRQALKDCTKEDPPASLTPSKRTLDESPGPARTIADLASRTQRKVFSTGFFASKKLKRFQNDSPSKLSRSSSNVSVVDLCSSDDEESKSEEGKPPASPKAFSPESKGGTSWTFGSPTKVGSRAFGSNPSQRKESNISSSIASNTASSEDIPRNKYPSSYCCTTDPSDDEGLKNAAMRFALEAEDTLPLADETEDKKSKEISAITNPSVDSPFRPSEGNKFICLRFDAETTCAPHSADEAEEKTFILESFSIERKRLLLDVLAPVTLSPEAMKNEKWTSSDVEPSVVSKAFYQRFGCLTTAELERLANGDFLVPEGMVSVKETLRAYRLSLKDMTKPSIEKETIEETSSMSAESNTNEDSNDSFAWDGTIELVQKDRSKESLSIIDLKKSLLKDDSEAKATALQGEENPNDAPSVAVKISKECESIGKDPSCEENQNEGRTGSSPTIEATLESSETEEGNEQEGTVTSEKEAEDSVKNTIVEYNGNDQPIENGEGQLPGFREARVALSDAMTNILDIVTSRFRQEQESFPEEIEVKNLIEGKENDEQSSEASNDDKEEKGEDEKDHPLIVVSAKQLLLLAIPLICLAGIFRGLGLFDVSNSILEGCFRTFVQLHILGSLLSPIFKYGGKRPLLVGCYALFMIVLASYEASSRTKYTHDGQFAIIVQSLVLNVGWVAMWAFGAILKPRPVWNPRYLLPIVGMLLGNTINGISITLDTITSSLVEKQSEVDLYLSFGADQYEAVSGIVAHAIQKGTTPSLNMMCVVGIVSIPGMMTGQILGGSSPMVAARYQAMIIFLIALSTLSTILVSSCFTVMSAFCSHQILRPDRFVKNRKRGLARLILWAWGYIFSGGKDVIPVGSNTGSGGLLADEEMNKVFLSTTKGFEIRSLMRGSVVSDGEGINSLIQVSGLNRYFSVEDRDGQCSETDSRRILFSDVSFLVNEGDLLLVSGPSGTGKSQLLRMMAGLSPLQEGDLWLQGKSWKDEYNGNLVLEWRRQVRYVTQTKVQIPGTPLQFIRKIQSFQSWKTNEEQISYDFMKHLSHHLRQWGMGPDSLNKDWAVLSGGESQRVLMAIALASRPKILLFDESTSALDHESKIAVETSIKDFVADHEGGVMWVSHDEQQAERMQSQ